MEDHDESDDVYSGLPPSEPDYSRLRTPARTLTLGRLHKMCDGNYARISDAVQTMLLLEDRIATINYCWAADLEQETPAILKRHKADIECLAQWYLITGLAAGHHQAEELIREIAAQGREQAPKLPPR
jgi:hypothetical protein